MRVLMFGWEFPPHISGGLGTACLGITQGLASQDVDVLFVLPRIDGPEECGHLRLLGANKVRASIGVREILELRERVRFLEVLSPLRPYLTESEYLRVLEQEGSLSIASLEAELSNEFEGGYGRNLMSEIVRYGVVAAHIASKEQFDVIHAHDWMTYAAGMEARRVSGKPLIVHAHALEFDRSGDHVNQRVYDIERAGFEAADLIVAVSHFTRDTIVRRYGISPAKIRVVHNAVRKERRFGELRLTRPLPEKMVLFLGRITFQKGPDYFVEAASRVLAERRDVRFVMAGSGDMFNRMVERMAELRMADRFHFAGFLRGADVERVYAMSDLYVMPSVSEPFGITPLEAMVYDVPVIVSKQSGVAEVLDNAVKIDFWDVDRLAHEMLTILNDENYAAELVQRGAQTLKRVKWERAGELLKGIYEEMAGGAA